jgi:cyclophilin family peptidyl-prolyl cis-trans isomerase
MLLTEPKELNSGVIATWKEIVRTDMDYVTKTSKATVYYYLDEQSFLDGKEPVFGEVIEVPYVEQEELKKSDVTAKTLAETAMSAKIEAIKLSVEETI